MDNQNFTKINLFQYASGLAGNVLGSGDGPSAIYRTLSSQAPYNNSAQYQWHYPVHERQEDLKCSYFERITFLLQRLADQVLSVASKREPFIAIGGNHVMGAATWSALSHCCADDEEMGLIWVDAHLDSHTPETSESGNAHGMPLAALLGEGYPGFTNLLSTYPKVKPENVVIIGARSFEQGEMDRLNRLNVRVHFMEEVKEKGFVPLFEQTLKEITSRTARFGVSFDLDSLDPKHVPGVGTSEPDGLDLDDVKKGFKLLSKYPTFSGCEIVEFNPDLDKDHLTRDVVVECIKLFSEVYQCQT